ncbi:hypothetical protein [Lysinibacillus sp. RC79]|uniref:hypothetical protein n=1 Tax=Lysinibacillus sp. RC79 TaxID=3156296 RepID=UPI003518501F
MNNDVIAISEELANALGIVDSEKAKRFAEAMIIVAESVGRLSVTVKELTTALNIMEPRKQEIKPIFNNRCFDKPRITHQVLSRKPQHLIKKIIR